MDPINIPAKFEVRSFIRSWDNRGYKKKDTPCIRPHSIFSQICNWLLFARILCIYLPNLTFVALPVPEIIGGTQKNLGHLWIRPRSLFSKMFHGLCSDGPCECIGPVNVSAKFAFHSFSRYWDNSNCSFGVGLWTPNLEEGEAVGGRGWHRSKERWRLPIGSP